MIYSDIWENITSRVMGAEARFQYNEEYLNWEKPNKTYWKLFWERNEKGKEIARWKLLGQKKFKICF